METVTEEFNLEEFELKEETVIREKYLFSSSTVENTCSVYIHGEEKKMKNIRMLGNVLKEIKFLN